VISGSGEGSGEELAGSVSGDGSVSGSGEDYSSDRDLHSFLSSERISGSGQLQMNSKDS
jgi:hypothetical protein